MANNVILPLLITKATSIIPNQKEERIDAARNFTVKAANVSLAQNDSLIIVVSQKTNTVETPTGKDIFEVGTLCRITSVTQAKNYIRIRLSGLNRVKLNNIAFDEQGYFVGEGELVDEFDSDPDATEALRKYIIDEITVHPESLGNISGSVINRILSEELSAGDLCDTLAAALPLKNSVRQTVLESIDINARIKSIAVTLNLKKIESDVDAQLSKDLNESTEKAQRDYILREKLKAIKHELGEDSDDDSDSIREKLEKEPYPEHVKNKVKAELKRFDMMPPSSLEASLIMSYVETLMAVPWYQKTEDNDDLNNVKKILDEDHYGLKKVKERIIEYLSVKKMTGTLKAPILCFYGPPGCGKTSLGASIARALGRKFFKASLGGISDEAEIRGHRRTYVGSMPGRIIAGMKRVGVTNPVFLLDEVDKLASSYKGDPASALLEVLDPSQNTQFNDNYLEEPYDLSNVLFICTANYLENVPEPLRDRLELIEVNSYTEFEKIEIAKNWLVKKELEQNGLNKKQFSITESAIKYLINYYTREAGVRELQRLIASLMRKSAVEILTSDGKVKSVKVDEKKIGEYLGKPIFENSTKEKEDSIGVVTGLAYTQFGGDILPIEVNYFKGKGGLILTGKLGDVMKESATIALDYVRANAEKYKVDPNIFADNDVHIHVPEGAVPKDGPSAGVALTTAIISCLSHRKVDKDVAMTGEVTLRGQALMIGGLREKSLAALRSGIKTIIVPEGNKRDVDELPQEVKDGLNILFMKNVDDAVKVAIKDD